MHFMILVPHSIWRTGLCLAACSLLGLWFSAGASAQVFLNATDDSYTTNDTGSGPTATNDRNDHVAVRNHAAPRKRIGYFKYDVSERDPQLFSVATLTGGFEASQYQSDGTFTIYGLNDGEQNLDNVADGSFTEENWTEGDLTYAMGLGVDVTVPPEEVGNMGIDTTEVSELGTIMLVDGEPIQSNTTDLPLESFLNADTNGVVTFMIADLVGDTEWRIISREASDEDSLRLTFTPTPGDTDLNGVVNLDDLVPIRMNYGELDVGYAGGDLNSDGAVTFADFRMWKTGLLAAGGSLEGVNFAFLNVPEPAAVGLAAIFCLAAVGLRSWSMATPRA